jgi:prepilin-type N-terminal cleavage/methylation domain-containing protein
MRRDARIALRARQTRRTVASDGFTLIEVVVAMAIFSVVAAVTLGVVLQTTRVAGSNLRRTAAANLVTRQIEGARSATALSLTDGTQTASVTVAGITYTVKQTVRYQTPDNAGSVCSSTGTSLAYKLVRVSVTWPNMGAIPPVQADTLKAVGVGSDGLDQTSLGTLALQVSNASGGPQAGVTVTLSPGNVSHTTGDDGCAVFAALSPGTYSVSASMAGWAGIANTQAASVTNLGVSAAGITRGNLLYDTTRSVNVQLNSTTGAYLPSTMPLRLGDSYVPETTYPVCSGTPTAACSSGLPGTVQALFPAVYTVKVGACAETSPSQATVDVRPSEQPTPTVTVPVATVAIDVRKILVGTSLAGRVVTATHALGCNETYTLPSTTAGGSLLVLPYGTWTLSTPIAPLSPTQVSTTVTLSASNATPSTVLTVTS